MNCSSLSHAHTPNTSAADGYSLMVSTSLHAPPSAGWWTRRRRGKPPHLSVPVAASMSAPAPSQAPAPGCSDKPGDLMSSTTKDDHAANAINRSTDTHAPAVSTAVTNQNASIDNTAWERIEDDDDSADTVATHAHHVVRNAATPTSRMLPASIASASHIADTDFTDIVAKLISIAAAPTSTATDNADAAMLRSLCFQHGSGGAVSVSTEPNVIRSLPEKLMKAPEIQTVAEATKSVNFSSASTQTTPAEVVQTTGVGSSPHAESVPTTRLMTTPARGSDGGITGNNGSAEDSGFAGGSGITGNSGFAEDSGLAEDSGFAGSIYDSGVRSVSFIEQVETPQVQAIEKIAGTPLFQTPEKVVKIPEITGAPVKETMNNMKTFEIMFCDIKGKNGESHYEHFQQIFRIHCNGLAVLQPGKEGVQVQILNESGVCLASHEFAAKFSKTQEFLDTRATIGNDETFIRITFYPDTMTGATLSNSRIFKAAWDHLHETVVSASKPPPGLDISKSDSSARTFFDAFAGKNSSAERHKKKPALSSASISAGLVPVQAQSATSLVAKSPSPIIPRRLINDDYSDDELQSVIKADYKFKGVISAVGTVQSYSDRRGFGFIKPDTGESDLLFRANNIREGTTLVKGSRVEFDLQPSIHRGVSKPIANDVKEVVTDTFDPDKVHDSWHDHIWKGSSWNDTAWHETDWQEDHWPKELEDGGDEGHEGEESAPGHEYVAGEETHEDAGNEGHESAEWHEDAGDNVYEGSWQ